MTFIASISEQQNLRNSSPALHSSETLPLCPPTPSSSTLHSISLANSWALSVHTDSTRKFSLSATECSISKTTFASEPRVDAPQDISTSYLYNLLKCYGQAKRGLFPFMPPLPIPTISLVSMITHSIPPKITLQMQVMIIC